MLAALALSLGDQTKGAIRDLGLAPRPYRVSLSTYPMRHVIHKRALCTGLVTACRALSDPSFQRLTFAWVSDAAHRRGSSTRVAGRVATWSESHKSIDAHTLAAQNAKRQLDVMALAVDPVPDRKLRNPLPDAIGAHGSAELHGGHPGSACLAQGRDNPVVLRLVVLHVISPVRLVRRRRCWQKVPRTSESAGPRLEWSSNHIRSQL